MDLPIIVIDVIFWSGALCKNVGLEVLALQLCCICQFWRVPRTWLNSSARSTKKTLHKMQLLAWWFSVYGFWHPLARRIEGATRDLDLTKRLWASPMNTTTSHAREHCNWIFGSTLLYTLQKRDREDWREDNSWLLLHFAREAEMASKALFFADPPNDPRKSW